MCAQYVKTYAQPEKNALILDVGAGTGFVGQQVGLGTGVLEICSRKPSSQECLYVCVCLQACTVCGCGCLCVWKYCLYNNCTIDLLPVLALRKFSLRNNLI